MLQRLQLGPEVFKYRSRDRNPMASQLLLHLTSVKPGEFSGGGKGKAPRVVQPTGNLDASPP
jgi:hypothetical protein